MKVLASLLTLVLVVSCGGKSSNHTTSHPEKQGLEEAETAYALPEVGFQRSVSLNYKFEHLYENLTVNPHENRKVLGANPFFIFLSEDNGIELKVYASQDIKRVSYLDLGKKFETTNIKTFTSEIYLEPNLKEIQDFNYTFTYGETNLDFPEQDMLNKVFIIETETGDLPHVSNMKTMFWVECHGGFKSGTKDIYSCAHGKLKFNYKLLDYRLNKIL